MSNLLYFDAYSGLSGDMTLGALLHLGLPFEHLQSELAKLNLPGYRLEMRTVEQHHISGIKLDVVLEEAAQHEHRPVSLIHSIIEESGLTRQVKDWAKAVFWALAQAESSIHNIPPDAVHFHEVGAVDAIVDIVGSCIGFAYFKVEQFYCSPLPPGSGFVRAAHGLLPVPAPATLQLLAQAGATLTPTVTLSGGIEYPARGEMVTPTGAALIAALCQPTRPAMTLKGVGYGFGSRQFEWPNALRLWLGTTATPPLSPALPQHQSASAHSHDPEPPSHLTQQPHDHLDNQAHSHEDLAPSAELPRHEVRQGEVSLLETNLDDMTPEGLGYLLEKLMAADALDVFFTPIQMKKNRPATKLSILARPADEARLAALVLSESSTFGVRCSRLTRYMAEREFRQVETPLGSAQVKLKILDGKVVEAVPEYEDVAALARQSGRPWREVYEQVKKQVSSSEFQV